ncbi:MAG: hypothetical protein K8S54_17370 [Spirochaetia bacterium]|nr:hypothetical protein [Spirochaetia bacterium]
MTRFILKPGSSFVLGCLLLLVSCGPTARIREGEAFLRQNKFDAALLSFQQAYLDSPENPAAQAALGRMLTLRRISFHAGLDLLKSSYDKKQTAALRRELTLLHMDAGDLSKAEMLLHPDHMTLEEYMTDPAALERAAVGCMVKQNEAGFYQLKSRANDVENAREVFLIRCLLSPGWRRSKEQDAREIYATITQEKAKCDIAVLFPAIANVTVELCRQKFPGDISLQREKITGMEVAQGKTRKLFEDDLFIPGEPPPQPKEETGGPFVPTTEIPNSNANPAAPVLP